jgi:2-polyprenyl-6-methoxyphenol hydroxylase-like FAD-dependent oxidoreductase
MMMSEYYDVVIIGAGLAGLSLARQLLLNSEKQILLVEKRAAIPPAQQKVGEATVQVSGYYFSKVLDLEEHLLREHFMKYNLRFFYKTAGCENRCYEDYSQSYIRTLSNIPTYQLDRNKLEAELLRLNHEHPTFSFNARVTDLSVSLADDGPHTLSFTTNGREVVVQTDWVVDTSGRGKFLARRLGLAQPNSIRHGASFLWVEGLVNIEKLTDLSPKEIRLRRNRAATGHLPVWLATNHFVGEGFWFWVIPLQGKTSLGLVYDHTLFSRQRVLTPQELIEWVCQEFPLFARDLPHRRILAHSAFKDFSYGCAQTIHPSKWALSGEAGRFTDPLYSPGGDFIALHNTLITDAILTTDRSELAGKCYLYELLMQSLYESLVPSYAISYDVLGDQEAYVLKYTWELSAYFAFFVFPFINDLSTDRRFVLSYLSKFSRLGVINKNLQAFISAYYQWKKSTPQLARGPLFHDFTALGPLRTAESTFYRVGLSVEEALQVLDVQLANLLELARFIVAYISSVVLRDERLLTNRSYIESIDLHDFHFDPDAMRYRYAECTASAGLYRWSFDPSVLSQFRAEQTPADAEMHSWTPDMASMGRTES